MGSLAGVPQVTEAFLIGSISEAIANYRLSAVANKGITHPIL